MVSPIGQRQNDMFPCLKHVTAQHDDVPVNHRHTEALFLRFGIRLGLGVRVGEDREQREVGAQTEQNEAIHTWAEGLAVLQKKRTIFQRLNLSKSSKKASNAGTVRCLPSVIGPGGRTLPSEIHA
jgi:hypothetical protein